MNITPELLTVLSATSAQVGQLCQLIPPAYLNWKPAAWEGVPGEQFSALEHVCHLRDIETDGYQTRIRRLLTEEQPELLSLDGYALALERRYAEANLAEALAAFARARQVTIELIGSLSAQQLLRTGFFEGYGNVTLAGLLYFLCSHDHQHLACLHWLLGKIHSQTRHSPRSQ